MNDPPTVKRACLGCARGVMSWQRDCFIDKIVCFCFSFICKVLHRRRWCLGRNHMGKPRFCKVLGTNFVLDGLVQETITIVLCFRDEGKSRWRLGMYGEAMDVYLLVINESS